MKEETQTKILTVALAGNPNSGKSTLFNELTGLTQKIGNYPGVTVDKKTGLCSLTIQDKPIQVRIVDLPGAYSLYPESEDERIASDILTKESNADHPDVVVFVADASNIRRSLVLCIQIIELGIPVLLDLNMIDIARKDGVIIDEKKLAGLLGIPVVVTNARKQQGIASLKRALTNTLTKPHLHKKNTSHPTAKETIEQYHKIDKILHACLEIEKKEKKADDHFKFDDVLTHPVWGYFIFFTIIFLVFQAVFSLAQYPMNAIDHGFKILGTHFLNILPEGPLADMLVHGILSGLSGVMIFIPQIAILFFFIAILENTGYMARVSFIMDRPMRRFGLSGRSVIPLISGVACAVPAIMSTRHIPNWKERMITIMATPFITCSARLPVYILVISLIIPDKPVLGLLNLQGITLMGMYLIGFLTAVLVSVVMKKLIKSKTRNIYIMEIPELRTPRWKDVFIVIYNKVKIFIFNVGRVIVSVSIILWVLASYSPGNAFEIIDKKYEILEQNKQLNKQEAQDLKAAEKLESSYAGRFGKAIEPILLPIGFNWKIGIGLITSFAAREIFVGTMATLYGVQSKNSMVSIREKMETESFSNGEKVYSTATGFSLLIFYAFAMQCISTLAVVHKETGHWKWPLIMFVYMTVVAYFASWIVFNFLH